MNRLNHKRVNNRIRIDKVHPAIAAIILGAALIGQTNAIQQLGNVVAQRGDKVAFKLDLGNPATTDAYVADASGFSAWTRP